MLVIIPVACFWLIGLCLYQLASKQREPTDLRNQFLCASLVWGVLIVIITEGLSLFRALTFGGVLTSWLVATLAAFLASLWLSSVHPRILLAPVRLKMPLVAAWCVAATLGITATLCFIALIAAPNNWDAMTYHLARVAHWIQDGTVAYYPTNNVRQLFDPPWAEYAILQFQILSGGDRFANLVQWFSMLGSCIGVSAIARQLGADLRGQAFAALLTATLPMGILQASSPQNDYVVTFWVVCLVYFLLALQVHPGWPPMLGVGVSLGLALLTKGTAYIYALPALAWLGIWAVRRLRREVWKPITAIGATAVLLNLGLYVRNITLFSNPLGPDGAKYVNQSHAPGAMLCSVVRELSLEMGTSSPTMNAALFDGVRNICTGLGFDPSDTRITWDGLGGLPFRINPVNTYQGTAGNPIHLLLIVLVIGLCLGLPALRTHEKILPYIGMLLGGFLFFCVYLKWQPWNGRLLLCFFVLATPLCGMVFSRLKGGGLAIGAIAACLVIGALPWLLANQNAPLLGTQTVLTTPRITQYFAKRPAIQGPYTDATHFVETMHCTDVGFVGGIEDWEYPLWVLFASDGQQVRIEHEGVTNATAALQRDAPFATFRPCAVIVVMPQRPATQIFRGRTYQRAWTEGSVSVYLPAAGGTGHALHNRISI